MRRWEYEWGIAVDGQLNSIWHTEKYIQIETSLCGKLKLGELIDFVSENAECSVIWLHVSQYPNALLVCNAGITAGCTQCSCSAIR